MEASKPSGSAPAGPHVRHLVGALLGAASFLLLAAPALALPVQGRVVHGETGRPVAGLEVRVVGMQAGQPPVEVATRTDRTGSFRVMAEPARRTYVVQAIYQGVVYTSGPHAAGRGGLVVRLVVFEATRQPPALALRRRVLLLDLQSPWFLVREAVVVHNPGLRTYVGGQGTAGTWRVPLLRGAEDVRVVRGMVPAGVDPDGALVDTLPVVPGERTAVLAYRVRARGPSLLELPLGLPTAALDVFVTEPLRVRSKALVTRATRVVEGRRVTWHHAEGLGEDAVVAMEVDGVPPPSRGIPVALASLLAVAACGFVAWPWLRRRG